MANFIDPNDFEQWNNEIDAEVEFQQGRNAFNRSVQQMYFMENGKHTRNAFFTLEQAEEQLNDNFNFMNGKNYVIKYLTNYQWKSGRAFQYANGMNLHNHVYNEDTEIDLYGGDALDGNTLRVYGIVVEEIA